jgi:ribosome-associated protein
MSANDENNGSSMIEITPEISLDESELEFNFVRSSGPGGQNVNKVATAVQLRFDLEANETLPEQVKRRLRHLAGRRVTKDGVLIIEASEGRSQERNRQQAVERLVELIRRAAAKPKPRKKTRPSAAARQRRLNKKRRRGQIKKWRRYDPDRDG